MKIGIVGLPNVGKSTLFKALTKKNILIANYPFATIDPNLGIVEVPDERLAALATVSKSVKIVPTTIEFYDIAGLVRGAWKGEGLGNQFLAYIREVDAIIEAVRVFDDPNVIHVHGKTDPQGDAEVIGIELAMADLKTVERRLHEVGSKARGGDKEAVRAETVLTKIKDALNKGTWAREIVTEDDREVIRDLHLLTMKPVLYVLNDDESMSHAGKFSDLQPQVTVSAKIESELVELPIEEARDMMASLGMKESGLDTLILASYKLLNLITYLTSGPEESRAWTIRAGTKAPQAAGVIHTDFEKGFIRVEVIDWKDFVELGETGAREKGKLRIEGKEYVMRDGDVCHFRFNP